MPVPQTAGGRYVSAYRDYELLDLVARVAGFAEGRLSQPSFDRLRDGLGYRQCPAARQICRRLNMSWDEVLDEVAEPDPYRRVLGRRRSRAQRGFSSAECAAAARTVALRMGRSVTPFDYEIEIVRMLAVDRRRHVHGRRLRMPRASQIERALKQPFGQAMKTAAAGLPDKKRAMHPSAALNACIHAHNAVPDEAQFATFCQAHDLVLADDPVTFAQMLVGLNASRSLAGAPPVPSPSKQAIGVDFSVRLPGLLERIAHKPLGNLAGAISALAACLDWLDQQPGRPELTEMAYQRFASTHPQWPWYATIQRHGGIHALRDKAAQWREERDRRFREGGSLPTTTEQQAAHRGAIQQKAWDAYLDRQGVAPFDRPTVNLPMLLADLVSRRRPLLAAILVALREHGPQMAAQLEDRLSRNRGALSNLLTVLTDLGAVVAVDQIPPARGRGPLTTVYGLAIDLPEEVIARARDYRPGDRQPPSWTDTMRETHRACLGLKIFGARDLADRMGFTTHVANQRLTRLVELGAVKRISTDPRRNDAYAYEAIASSRPRLGSTL